MSPLPRFFSPLLYSTWVWSSPSLAHSPPGRDPEIVVVLSADAETSTSSLISFASPPEVEGGPDDRPTPEDPQPSSSLAETGRRISSRAAAAEVLSSQSAPNTHGSTPNPGAPAAPETAGPGSGEDDPGWYDLECCTDYDLALAGTDATDRKIYSFW